MLVSYWSGGSYTQTAKYSSFQFPPRRVSLNIDKHQVLKKTTLTKKKCIFA